MKTHFKVYKHVAPFGHMMVRIHLFSVQEYKMGVGLSSKIEELNCTLLKRKLQHGNLCIVPVAEISRHCPRTLLVLFRLSGQLEHQDTFAC